MRSILSPTSVPELADAVRSLPRLLPVGAQTKPGLSAVDVPKLSTKQLRGILEYDPSEFTFTALAGTPLSEIQAALSEKGQYLPFDPFLVEAGATLGGTVASGLSGPGRFRFGGVRDFILGVRFVDGSGRVLRMGGKVVKNAAGFDLPKFFVGSLGRFGVLAEITFKVFPRPISTLTLSSEPRPLGSDPVQAASQIMIEAAKGRWEIDALDLLPDGKTICLRLAGPAAALEQLSADIFTHWPGRVLSAPGADAVWSDLREFRWAYSDGPLVKVPLTPAAMPKLLLELQLLLDPGRAALPRGPDDLQLVPTGSDKADKPRAHISAGGNVAFISLASAAHAPLLDEALRRLGLRGLGLGAQGPLWYGERPGNKITQAVKLALDPDLRFPALD